MKVVINSNKDEVMNKIIQDINSNNRYIGDGYKIAGKIDPNKIYLNLEDRRDKSSKFMNEVFYGNVDFIDGKTVITGKFRIDTIPFILFLILFIVAVESLVVSLVFNGINPDIFLPAIILVFEVLYLISFKNRSKTTNKYIENYLSSLYSEI